MLALFTLSPSKTRMAIILLIVVFAILAIEFFWGYIDDRSLNDFMIPILFWIVYFILARRTDRVVFMEDRISIKYIVFGVVGEEEILLTDIKYFDLKRYGRGLFHRKIIELRINNKCKYVGGFAFNPKDVFEAYSSLGSVLSRCPVQKSKRLRAE